MELISKEEVIKAIEKLEQYTWEEKPIENRPKGKWIKGDMFECDQCHHRMIVGDGAYNYCPNCGAYMVADMRGEE